MNIRILLAFCLLSRCASAQNLVQTTDETWRPVDVYLEKREQLGNDGIAFLANGAIGINAKGETVVVTCAHVYDDTSGAERLGSDAISFTVPGLDQDKDRAVPIGQWDPAKPVRIVSFLPGEQRVAEIETHAVRTTLLDELALVVNSAFHGGPDAMAWEAYSEVPKDKDGKERFEPGVSGSPLMQDGKIVGVVSWVITEPRNKTPTQVVGYSLFGNKPRSRVTVYGTLIAIPLTIVSLCL